MDAETIRAIAAHLKIQHEIVALGPDHKILVTDGAEGPDVVDLRPFMPPPERIKQRAQLLTVDALLLYIARYGTTTSVIFANEPSAIYEVVFDYHSAIEDDNSGLERGDCEHTAVYTCPQSDQWKLWNAASGKMVGQLEFATFLENNLKDIAFPEPAAFMELALHFHIHKQATFESGQRLTDGSTQFHYSEDIKGSSNKKAGNIEIPAMIRISIPVFVDGHTYNLEARFKYRLNEGQLSLGYDLIRPLDVYREAVKDVTTSIAKGAPSTMMMVGYRA